MDYFGDPNLFEGLAPDCFSSGSVSLADELDLGTELDPLHMNHEKHHVTQHGLNFCPQLETFQFQDPNLNRVPHSNGVYPTNRLVWGEQRMDVYHNQRLQHQFQHCPAQVQRHPEFQHRRPILNQHQIPQPTLRHTKNFQDQNDIYYQTNLACQQDHQRSMNMTGSSFHPSPNLQVHTAPIIPQHREGYGFHGVPEHRSNPSFHVQPSPAAYTHPPPHFSFAAQTPPTVTPDLEPSSCLFLPGPPIPQEQRKPPEECPFATLQTPDIFPDEPSVSGFQDLDEALLEQQGVVMEELDDELLPELEALVRGEVDGTAGFWTATQAETKREGCTGEMESMVYKYSTSCEVSLSRMYLN